MINLEDMRLSPESMMREEQQRSGMESPLIGLSHMNTRNELLNSNDQGGNSPRDTRVLNTKSENSDPEGSVVIVCDVESVEGSSCDSSQDEEGQRMREVASQIRLARMNAYYGNEVLDLSTPSSIASPSSPNQEEPSAIEKQEENYLVYRE